jgi:MOSC domain-containing protein YiiM
MDARVVAVCSKETPGVGKVVRDEIVLLANRGVEGDYHAGEFVRHRSRAAKNATQPNLRQVHLVHAELFDELAAVGIVVQPGQMGENVTTRGLPILELAPGSRLHLGAGAVVRVTGLRNPCNQLDAIDERLLAEVASKLADGTIVRRAGIMAVVERGGAVRAGDPIRLEASAGAHGHLEPV